MMTKNRAMNRPPFYRPRSGFTLIELLLVIVIMGILMTYAIPSFTRMMNERNAQNARDALVWAANRARARAVERGQTQLFVVSPARNAAWIVRRGGTTAADTLQMINFEGEHQAVVTTSTTSPIVVCYNPRGYAFDCDGNSPDADVTATLSHAGKTAIARIKPLGQVERI